MSEEFKAGTVALAGRPNAGKSTLLNRVLGQKLAITSPKPQTTRNRIVGIHTTDVMQVVMVDTPGIHPATTRLNRSMVQAATASLTEVDVICMVVDATRAIEAAKKNTAPLSKGDEAVAEMVEQAGAGGVVVALNKVDRADKRWLLPVIQAWSERLPGASIVPISALKGVGIDALLEEWARLLPTSPPLFPAEQWTEQSERFVVAELIREKVFKLTEKELPYATAVEIESFDEAEREGDRPKVIIHARILVERDTQKAIVIGKGGSLLKKIGTRARIDIERLLGVRVYLDLHVVVRKDWAESQRMLKTLGYDG